MRYLRDIGGRLSGKTCLVRTNLDIADPHPDSLRIEKAVPTIKFLLEYGAKPIIISHRGKPKGKTTKNNPIFSLKPAIDILSKKLGQELEWRENLRLDPREEKNDSAYAKKLAVGADIYINDDFATSHHEAASLSAITRFLPSYAGLLLQDEIKALSAVRDNPKKPLVVIIGGIKMEDKIRVIEYLKNKADWFLLGSAYGAIRETLFIPPSSHSEVVPHNAHIILPIDFTKEKDAPRDIGPKTIKHYSDIIATARTIIWNGPLGNVEKSAYAAGSEAIARAIIQSKALCAVGGGDTVDFLTKNDLLKKFGFASTGGGAMLAFLAGKELPALTALDNCPLV